MKNLQNDTTVREIDLASPPIIDAPVIWKTFSSQNRHILQQFLIPDLTVKLVSYENETTSSYT